MKKLHVVSGRVECPESLHLAACLERFLLADGCELVESRAAADLVVLNGCERIVETPAVVREYRDFARAHPAKTVLVVGCVPADAARSGEVANLFVVPFWQLVRDPSIIGPRMGFSRSFALLPKDDVFHGRFPVEEDIPGDPPPAEVALLTTGWGCRGRCSYCSIRRGRGACHSRPAEEILADAGAAVGHGRFRFLLVGDDAGCWGHDLGLDLPYLLEQLVRLCPRARFLVRPLNPAHLPALFAGLRPFLERIDYLYAPLQSGSDRILHLMQRGYEARPILELLEQVRAAHPGVTLKTDIIVGFPSETRAEFRESVAAARHFDHAGFHRFVAYPGTPAATLPGRLAEEELRLRMAVVRRLGFDTVDPSTYAYEPHGAATQPPQGGTKGVHVVTANSECMNTMYLALCLQRFLQTQSYVHVGSADEADVLVLNVCNVLAETPDLIETYREVARRNPAKQVLVLGCVPGGVATTPEVENFHVVPYGQLVRDPALIGPRTGFQDPFTLLKADDVFGADPPVGRLPRPLSEYCYLTIASGCEGHCTYCSIRAGRGAARSTAPDEILADARAGFAAGRFRLVLIADDAGCWGRDLGLDLPHLLGRLVAACPSVRFVILDFNPRSLPGMFDRLLPFLERIDSMYLPLQSGNDRILGLMRREYRAGEILQLLRRMRAASPRLVLETDFIVGFPSETDEEFRDSVEAAKRFTVATFVPYVPKADTPAAKLAGRVAPEELQRRMAVVTDLAPRFGFKPIDPSIAGRRHGVVGEVSFADRRVSPAVAARETPVIEIAREGPVLQPAPQPCLARFQTINLTAGCPLACLECDVETPAPAGPRGIFLFADTAPQLRRELDAAQRVPALVTFSSASEPFVSHPRVLAALRDTMILLLERGVFLLVETRAQVPAEFVELFAHHARQVKVQVGLSTVDERVRAVLEPHAATTAGRLATMRELGTRGVACEVGIGPLVPGLDDTDAALTALCAAVADCGVRTGSVAFLHVTEANRGRLAPITIDDWTFADMVARHYDRTGAVWQARADYRGERFGKLATLAHARGLELRLCRCNSLAPTVDGAEESPLDSASLVPAARLCPTHREVLEPLLRGPGPGAQAAAAQVAAAQAAAAQVAAAPAPEDALLAFVSAGGAPGPWPVDRKDPRGGPARPAGGLPSAPRETPIPVGAGRDDTAAWLAVRTAAESTPATEPVALLPTHAGLVRALLRWLGRAGVTGEAFLSSESLRLEVADPGQEGGTAQVIVKLHVDGEPFYRRIGAFNVSYRGAYTEAVKQVTGRIVRYVEARQARPR